ncbi:hypothetical protein GCM10023333_24300 [Ferrimonas pelagia]|uniref:Uncharacterized protein n=1 Tax=Ferrimonas pelagia TaxID=1177826 RepID=A0ABP9EZ01_9GAMM
MAVSAITLTFSTIDKLTVIKSERDQLSKPKANNGGLGLDIWLRGTGNLSLSGKLFTQWYKIPLNCSTCRTL